MLDDTSRHNYLRPLNFNQSSIQNLLSIGAEVESVLPSYWFGKKPFPKQEKVSEYVEWVGFSRFASLFKANSNRGDGDWNTFNTLLKDKPVWKRWEKLETTGEPPSEKQAKKITILSFLNYIKKLREIRDALPWDSTVVISPLSTSNIVTSRYYKMVRDDKGELIKKFEQYRVNEPSGFPQVTLKKPSDCDKEIKEIEKLLSAIYDEIDKRIRK